MRIKRIIIAVLMLAQLFTSNAFAKATTVKEEYVSVINKGDYYEVKLDLQKCKSHREIGKEYGKKILQAVPDYQSILDSYLAEMTASEDMYALVIQRVNDIKPQIEKDYRDEIEGMASVMSGKENVRGDNKLSLAELYMLNLFPDAARSTQCSALAVYSNRSETRNTMTARILDWNVGSKNQLVKLQSVMTINNGKKSICSIGYLGFLGIISGLNNDKVFAAILDSKSGEPYTSEEKRSYTLDLRYALENSTTLTQVASYMAQPERQYAVGHLIFLSDSKTASVLENNISTMSQAIRGIRTENSELNEGISWGIDNSIGTVNSFLLKGNLDNHSSMQINTQRWKSMKEQLKSKGDTVSLKELEKVITYHKGNDTIGTQEEGALYNVKTQQIILCEPKTFLLKVFFKPYNKSLPLKPVFKTIKVGF